MASVHVSDHPLLLHRLALLRNRATEPTLFRALVREMSQMLFWEATRDLKTRPIRVQTPLAESDGRELTETIGLVPILRAGLGMVEAILELVPTAQVWHLGLFRDHETCQPVTYYNKRPSQHQLDRAFVLDPMLATGGSARTAVNILRGWGVERIAFLGLIAAPEGVRAVQESYPDVPIFLGAVDRRLDEHSYIVPGLGDAGDRQFGTG